MSRNDERESLYQNEYNRMEDSKDPDGYTSGDENFVSKLLFPVNFIATKFKAGSLKGSIFTLITATIGTGILLIPNAVSKSGLAWGILQLGICGIVGYYSLMMVVRCAEKSSAGSYQELAQITCGNWLRVIVNIAFFATNWGTAIAYLVLVSQLVARALGIFFGIDGPLPHWMTDPNNELHWIWLLIIATAFVLPLSLAKELKSLRYFCLLSFGFIIFLAAVVVFEAFNFVDFSKSTKAIDNFDFSGTSTTFSTAVFAYLSHPNLLDVHKELHNSTKRRMRKVILRTTILVFFTYSLVGSFGYITFATNLNVLSNVNCGNGIILFGYGYDMSITDGRCVATGHYPVVTVVALILIGMSVIIATPLCIKPAKDGLSDLIFPKKNPTDTDPPVRHVILVLICIYSAVLLGILSKSMQTVINILGASFFTMIAFLMPPLFYIRLSKNSKLFGHKIICYIMLVVFSVFMVWSTYESIVGAINES